MFVDFIPWLPAPLLCQLFQYLQKHPVLPGAFFSQAKQNTLVSSPSPLRKDLSITAITGDSPPRTM